MDEEVAIAINIVKQTIQKNLHVKSSLSASGLNKNIQHFSRLKFSNSHSHKIYELVFSAALSAEKVSPGAGLLLLDAYANNTSLQEDLGKTKNTTIQGFIKSLAHISRKNLEIVKEILFLSTMASSIVIKKSTSNSTFVEVYEGYAFTARSLIEIRPLILKDVVVACIDGYIENVSEIHHFLTIAAEKKIKCVLLCRGASQDVIHTMKVNNDRGVMTVYPFQIQYEIDGINTLVDVASVVGCDVTSSHKGDLISSIDIESLKKVEVCNLQTEKIIIKNSSTKKAVKNHVKNIREKMDQNPDLTEVLQKRVRSLSASCIEVGLPNDINYSSNSIELDEAIRMIMAISSRTASKEEVASVYLKSLNSTLGDIGCMI